MFVMLCVNSQLSSSHLWLPSVLQSIRYVCVVAAAVDYWCPTLHENIVVSVSCPTCELRDVFQPACSLFNIILPAFTLNGSRRTMACFYTGKSNVE